jgi:hypothetical protein
MIAAILPAKGRIDQTLALIPRLTSTAGISLDAWRLIVVIDDDPELFTALSTSYPTLSHINQRTRRGYWQCMRDAVRSFPATRYVVNLANDLLPGRDWLRRALEVQKLHRIGSRDPVVGFNDGIATGSTHASHFLAPLELLNHWYGAEYFPTCYDHMFGDTEICRRAVNARRLVPAPYAVLYHNHAYVAAKIDDIYRLGHKHAERDQFLFEWRNSHGWPRIETKESL